eukprot:m.159854 g.159854  ORF g.159854 m.159854 type:complete len:457 (-) comp14540_c0_seq1:156-1526(-)
MGRAKGPGDGAAGRPTNRSAPSTPAEILLTPEHAHVESVKARLAQLERDATTLADEEEALTLRLQGLARRRAALRASITQAHTEITAATNAPLASGDDPTLSLPDELLVAVLLRAPLESLWLGTVARVCRRWRDLAADPAVQRRKDRGRWVAYANGWVPPKVLRGHTGQVRAVAVGDDGTIYSGADDHTVRMWSADDGVHLRTFIGHTHNVLSLALTGETLISGSYDRTIRVWSTLDGAMAQTLRGHTCAVRAVLLMDDGSLCTGSLRDIRIWAPSNPVLRGDAQSPAARAGGVTTREAAVKASTCSFSFVRVINIASAVNGLALGTRGLLYAVDLDGVIRVWTGQDGAEMQTVDLGQPDGSVYTQTGYSRTSIAVVSPGERPVELLSGSHGVQAVAIDGGGSIFCSGVNDTVREWSGECGLLHYVLQGCNPTLTLSIGSKSSLVVARDLAVHIYK